MRRLVQEVSLAHGFTEEEVRRIVLAMDEACTNVIRHAYGGDPGGSIDIEAHPIEDGLRFVVIDHGRKPDPDTIAPRALELRQAGSGPISSGSWTGRLRHLRRSAGRGFAW
jgi:anti-sigma regulatory factor (Ser/Thr protein kinase)